jgi:hypothetical protein
MILGLIVAADYELTDDDAVVILDSLICMHVLNKIFLLNN